MSETTGSYSTISTTRFAWECIGAPAWPPPWPKKRAQYGPDAVCWLCGGPTDGIGWPYGLAIAPTFTNVTLAACPTSQTVCQPCVYMSHGDAWRDFCGQRPGSGLKSVSPLSWRSYPHAFWQGHHESPSRARWRELLLLPPDPPFLYVIPTSGQKHTLFRARVSHDTRHYFVQWEEQSIPVSPATLLNVLTLFEEMYIAGASKDAIATGSYSAGHIARVGMGTWQRVERRLAEYRRTVPLLLALAGHIARKPDGEDA